MKFPNPYWSARLKINALQRWILIHSILYYELNESIVSDRTFDDNEHQLVRMQREFPESAKQSRWWYIFKDFDGSTGFDLYKKCNEADKKLHMQYAQDTLKQFRR